MKWTTSCASTASKLVVLERELLGRAVQRRDVGIPLAEGRDEGLGRLDGGDVRPRRARSTSSAVSAPGPAPTSSTRCPLDDACEVREQRRERARVPPHEPVVRLGGDGEAHRPGIYALLRAHASSRRPTRVAGRPRSVLASPCVAARSRARRRERRRGRALTLEQQVGQLIVLSFSRDDGARSTCARRCGERRAAGVILFGEEHRWSEPASRADARSCARRAGGRSSPSIRRAARCGGFHGSGPIRGSARAGRGGHRARRTQRRRRAPFAALGVTVTLRAGRRRSERRAARRSRRARSRAIRGRERRRSRPRCAAGARAASQRPRSTSRASAARRRTRTTRS